MLDIMTIEKINKFVDENCADLTDAQKSHCFTRLYSSFGSMSYDQANTELMAEMLSNLLKEIKPPKNKSNKKIRYNILEPRYHDKTVLLSKTKMPNAPVEVVFTNCKSLNGILFEVDGAWVKKNCTIGSNGVIPCYIVPMEALENKGLLIEKLPGNTSEQEKVTPTKEFVER